MHTRSRPHGHSLTLRLAFIAALVTFAVGLTGAVVAGSAHAAYGTGAIGPEVSLGNGSAFSLEPGLVDAFGVAGAASAAPSTSRYVPVPFRQPTSSGLAVRPPLSEFRAVAGARVVVPTTWRRATAGQERPCSRCSAGHAPTR
jgi:hypothetical protein